MSLGPGKYDHLCTQAREGAKAAGALLIIFDGERGDGFSIQTSVDTTTSLPAILRILAEDIERDLLELWKGH